MLPVTLERYGELLVDRVQFTHVEVKNNNTILADWLQQVYERAHSEYGLTLTDTLEALHDYVMERSGD